MASQIHVVSKADLAEHATVSLDLDLGLPPLPSGAVRAATRLVGITANNFTYARLGGLLSWWDAYPVPAVAPPPHNDPEAWGIVPAWGYAEVLESNVDGIPTGASLWGFWPTSSRPVDLQLQPAQPAGYYAETSPHRQKLMTLYNRYELARQGDASDEFRAWRAAAFPVWTAGYLLNRYTFAEDPARRLHPFGAGEWTSRDADLASAAVVVLSASSKAGRSAVWNLGGRAPGRGPLALLQVVSDPGQPLPLNRRAAFPARTVSYADVAAPSTLDWLSGLKPARVVFLDFGGPPGTARRLRDATAAALPASTAFTLVAIGSAPAVLPGDEQRAAAVEADAQVGRFQFNASPTRDAGRAVEGDDDFFAALSAEFQRWLDEAAMGDLSLSWGRGVAGPDGVEGAWKDLCTGRLPRQKAHVYRLP